MTWSHVGMLLTLVLATYLGVKTINRLFERYFGEKKKKNSLFER